jgi:TetR/AcrR family transcriptional regulator, regulator of autoinduction and epiphytic fitness
MWSFMTKAAASPATAPDDRRRRLLDAALATFGRFGFRKTSMEEVARAGRLSRQGLYLHFSTKEDLFRAAVRYALETGIEAASARLGDSALSVEEKLAGAFDEWVGRYVGMIGADVTDLEEARDLLVGPLVAEHEALFIKKVAKMIRASPLPAAYKPVGLTARQLADTLHATALGLKHVCASRAEFGERFAVAVRALCLPLRRAADQRSGRNSDLSSD